MEYISVRCPHCGKELKVPSNAADIVCMFCAKPINIAALMDGKTENSDDSENLEAQSAVEQAKNALPAEVFTFKIQLNQMNAKLYPTVFKNFQDVIRPFWPAFNNAAILDENKTLEEMSDLLLAGYTDQLEKGGKKRYSNGMFDCRFTITSLLIPSMLEQNSYAEKLADAFLEKWNKKYPKQHLGKASYEFILKGFKKKFCFITTAACLSLKKGDNCAELNKFRSFRDNWFLNTETGNKKITEYYLFAPIIVSAISSSGQSGLEYKRIWKSYLKPCLNLIDSGKNMECAQRYEGMMHELEEKWL